MNKIKMNSEVFFAIEPLEKKVRLVIFQNKEEWVCRKETAANLYSFLKGTDSRIFKGRLQLHKVGNKINVEVKKELVGIINAHDFKKLLAAID